MKVLTGVFVISALLAQTPASGAIFSGGPSDGYAAGASGNSDLSGNVGRSHKFTGGPGDGFSAKVIIFTPSASVDAWERYELDRVK